MNPTTPHSVLVTIPDQPPARPQMVRVGVVDLPKAVTLAVAVVGSTRPPYSVTVPPPQGVLPPSPAA